MVQLSLEQHITINSIPSGSSLAYANSQFYLIGDDATSMGIFNEAFNLIEQVKLWEGEEYRIPKKQKADLEASCIINDTLYIFGSGSKGNKRDWIVKYNLLNKAIDKIQNIPFYDALRTLVDEINIEAAEFFNNTLILGNRGHKKNPSNTFLYANFNNEDFQQFNLKKINLPISKEWVMGISGLTTFNNQIWATFSSEDTDNAIDDGAIGPSALAIFSISDWEKALPEITPTQFIWLNEIDKRFEGNKIESLAIVDNNLFLVADNDNGASQLFKLLMV
jgi:hypothetical protein